MGRLKNLLVWFFSFHQSTALPALLGVIVGHSLQWRVVRDGTSYYYLDLLLIGGLALFLLHLHSQWVRRKLKAEIRAELFDELKSSMAE